jgi:hypothetical protein
MTPEAHEQEHADIHNALFGNKETGEMGIVQMNKEMYQAWSAVIWLGKVITWIAVVVAGIGTAWMAIGGAIKHFFTNGK